MLMDHYLLSGLFALVITLWIIVAVKCESVCRSAADGPTDDETETANQDVDNEQ